MMFRPQPMQHVTLYLMADDVPRASVALAECGTFDPYPTRHDDQDLPGRPGREYQALYKTARVRLEKIFAHAGLLPASDGELKPRDIPPQDELAELNDWLGTVWRECSQCEEDLNAIHEQQRYTEQLQATLENFTSLDINLGLLQSERPFLDLRVGTLPPSNLRRLSDAVSLIGYSVSAYQRSTLAVNVVITGLKGSEPELQKVLDAASYRPLDLPREFTDAPDTLRSDLDQQLIATRQREEQLAVQVVERRQHYSEQLRRAEQALHYAAPYATLADNLRSRGALTQLNGWVPSARLQHLQQHLTQRLDGTFYLEHRNPNVAEYAEVPSALSYPRLLRPFVTLVRNYGIPRYSEIDPSWLFAISFILMFGMMFGDIGHGVVLAGLGWWQHRRLKSFTTFAILAGLSSMLFGALYGSVFGYEELFHPLWMSPLSDPILMLTLALYWGIGFIILATGLTIRNRLSDRRFKAALLTSDGLAGLLFYLALLHLLYRLGNAQTIGIHTALLVATPFTIILVNLWMSSRSPPGERALIVLIEGFETIMSYVSNTLSFLRVAAFSLNHVALAIAVFTLAGMLETTGYWIAVVLGNLFILVLEGGIVAIQVLRLEYYEGFSRFFSGDGRAFRPLSLERESSREMF